MDLLWWLLVGLEYIGGALAFIVLAHHERKGVVLGTHRK